MHSVDSTSDSSRHILQVYVGQLSLHYEALSVEASKQTTAEEIVSCIVERLGLTGSNYELAEVVSEDRERRLAPQEKPVSLMLLWPKHSERDRHRFYLRECQTPEDFSWLDTYGLDSQVLKEFLPFLLRPENREYPDLCQLPDLNESTLLENLKQRFEAGHIYTYVGSILIAVNPFKFLPIYNPKYVRLYQNQRISVVLPPHIFAIADNAYYCMLKEKRNQCVVISGESGSGKTESTNFLLHHLTALSQKGSHGSGVEQTILSAGPVLEAFGNAKTAHNNNSSRFGKFIQVNYRENGMVQGAVVQKYLLEKSRIVSQGSYERNYHVFYYLLSGATEPEREALHLLSSDKYNYLNAKNLILENCDEKYEFSRLKQSMEMVGFSAEKQRRLFAVLSAVLLLGNVEFYPKKSTYHHDESVQVRNSDVVALISELLKVKYETLLAALTSKRVKASGETLIMQYKLPEAIAARDALAKCLYGALFDWIVLQVNHALLNKDQTPHYGHSIGVLDIFGFEDFGMHNSFEQLCINYANEHLQYYFNLHVFKFEQKEYKREGIKWKDIEFLDNSGCLQLFEGKPAGLLCILDDLSNFPGATNELLLQKFNSTHKEDPFYEKPQKKENAFIIKHYAGKVKYQVAETREKNLDLMRQDIVSVLKNSSMAFVRELVGADPVAVFRWAILRAFFRGYFAFRSAGLKHRKERADQSLNKITAKTRFRTPNESLVSKRLSGAAMTYGNTSSNNSISNSNNSLNNDQSICNATNIIQRAHNNLAMNQYATTTSTRRSWSTFGFNNKNFPDGKLTYEQNSSISTGNNGGTTYTKLYLTENSEVNKFSIRDNKFERTNQDVMARASQIVMKNKSFRPRERPKKGLKNLQSVKLTAGQNLNNQTAVKTRKQPLTVTAQFQNSLIALMETLNQANPFFIRCIKSNPNKIANQFDDATVTRQLRYTGMLETVRIRRAGYNVRLTYEEFIQMYRILLPKGLLSSQKDVRDFMYTMDLNKQHYQLGITKLFMRESQKIRLDFRLHEKILKSIVCIQRWFRSILQRRKYLLLRSAAITIQSGWRMVMAQKQVMHMKRINYAATIIQTTWRMYKARKCFIKLKCGIVVVQSHIRGKLARKDYRLKLKSKQAKESRKLRSTQSLPVHERSIDVPLDIDQTPKRSRTPHYSLDTEIEFEYCNEPLYHHNKLVEEESSNESFSMAQSTESNRLYRDRNKRDMTLDRTEQQIRDLLISSPIKRQPSATQDDVLDRPSKLYDLEKASKSYFDEPTTETLKRFDATKTPIRRVDSGPGRREVRYDGSGNVVIGAPRPVANTNVEIVYVNNPIDSLSATKTPLHQYNQDTVPHRRDIITRSTGEDLYRSKVGEYENVVFGTRNTVPALLPDETLKTTPVNTPKGKAAALLGATPEPPVQKKDTEHSFLSKTKRTKNNMSDDSHHSSHFYSSSKSSSVSDETLRRRNSDPTNKIPLLEVNRGNDLYQSSTNINIGGHRFRKVNRITKNERCASCDESDSFILEGHRCLDCKILVHTKCIQNGGIKTIKCVPKRSKRVKKISEKSYSEKIGIGSHNSKYSGTREYTDSTDKIIRDAKELQLMQDFITQKICKMENGSEKVSEVDKVFKQALREFKDNLVAQYSIAHKSNSDSLNIKYRDLIANFEQVIGTACGRKDDFPLTMGVNAFRGFMNEFMNSRETEKPKAKRKKDKKRKADEFLTYNGHTFQLTIINIATVCEICQLFLLWPIERGLVCQNCPLTCHKKCHLRALPCSKSANNMGGPNAANPSNSKLFGIPLVQLCGTSEGSCKIPSRIDQLMTKIDAYGLYAEGIYRKSGVNSKIKELKQLMSEPGEINYENYNVHVLTNVLKSFLREMPEPLLTFDRYDDFLRAADLSDDSDRVQTLLSLIKKLPPTHHALLERLIFHLALVAQREQYNRMSASSLAIVFAPCLLRTNRNIPAQDSLNDISRQTKCMETLITQKMLNVKNTLADIDTLDTAAHTASTRLSTLRSSKVFTQEEFTATPRARESEAEEMLLEGHIQEIKKEKALLTSTLPSLARASSDDDLLSTDLDGEGGSLDDLSNSKDKDMNSMDPSPKDSVDSMSFDASTSHSQDVEMQDQLAVSYNLRDRNIDYIPTTTAKTMSKLTSTPLQQKSLDSFQRQNPPVPVTGCTSGGKSWTGSQQNLNYRTGNVNIITCSLNSSAMEASSNGEGGTSITKPSELQRQKPIVMRSISGGYESATGVQQQPKIHTSSSSIGILASARTTSSTSSSTSSGSNVNNNEDRKPKRQNSIEDEPIMV